MTPDMVQAIIGILSPLVVWGVTQIIKAILPSIQGWGIVAVVVPVVGLLVTLVTNLVTNAGPHWYFQLALSLLAVFVQEFYKQIKQAATEPPAQ